MPETSEHLESLFAAAIEVPTEERAAFLNQECGNDEELRQRLVGLLDAHDRSRHPLDQPPNQFDGVVVTQIDSQELVNTVIADRYKLLEQIGEGGMGTVWVAEQIKPVTRKVALKLIKPGMDSKNVLARFEAERQALAMMDHPNIAKVLDGGITDNGRPYFVMEYVKGVPITEYCDQLRLSINDRLDLFVQVCSAVQHAHQKGIIHRDLKPSNILVAPYDDKPIPKVIDFGLAKALHQRLTERTIHTAHETVIGTPLYMSPEQAQLNNLDVDTRTDVYSLGVLLYELLTGTTPLEKGRFKQVAWDEIRRIIREEDPPKPSTRVTSTGTLPSLAAFRQTEPVKLTQQIKGELDWIVMKSLEKERTRRYETANGLARDIQRFLSGETVEACPPTFRYRLQKTFRRHRGPILTSALIGCLLIVATSTSTWLAIRATRAERRTLGALQERDQVLLVFRDVLEEFNPYKHPDNATIQEVLLRACEKLDNKTDITTVMKAKVRMELGSFFISLHEYKSGYQQYEKAFKEFEKELGKYNEDTVRALYRSGIALQDGRQSLEDLKKAEKILTDAWERNARTKGESDISTLRMLDSLTSCIFQQARFDDVIRLHRRSLKLASENPEIGEDSLTTAYIRFRLAGILTRSTEPNQLDEAKLLCEKGIARLRRERERNKEIEPDLHRAEILLFRVSHLHRHHPENVRKFAKLVEGVIQSYDTEEHDSVIEYYDGLALASLEAAETSIAERTTRKLVELSPKVYGQKHPNVRRHTAMRGEYFVVAGQHEHAEELLKQVLASDEAKADGSFEGGWDNFTLIRANHQYGICLRQRHENRTALAHFEIALKLLEQRMNQMGIFKNRYMLVERFRILKSLRELYIEFEDHEKAENAQVAILQMQKTLDRIPQ